MTSWRASGQRLCDSGVDVGHLGYLCRTNALDKMTTEVSGEDDSVYPFREDRLKVARGRGGRAVMKQPSISSLASNHTTYSMDTRAFGGQGRCGRRGRRWQMARGRSTDCDKGKLLPPRGAYAMMKQTSTSTLAATNALNTGWGPKTHLQQVIIGQWPVRTASIDWGKERRSHGTGTAQPQPHAGRAVHARTPRPAHLTSSPSPHHGSWRSIEIYSPPLLREFV